ncbi:outer membrane beta-barrel protein [Paraflavitalea pollutisoli]|uniref:outer membrane beta-barrel protein n=1 Tax=Paraflavitalea pollutisoli TaxID=3034143 RepID=UPI0023ED61C9|nr:outer membrane beta-barrel protein [Paraflavitalea sp. H1-2-19X]
MKKQLLFTVIAIAASSALTAQVTKGDILLGASAGTGYNGYSSTGSAGSNSTNANIAPRIGFGIGRNSVLGARLNFNYWNSKSPGTDYKQNNLGAGASIYWRHFMPIVSKVGWYIEPAAGVGTVRQKSQDINGKSKINSFNITATVVPGVYYQALPGLLLNADFGGVNYQYSKNKNGTSVTSKSHSVSLGLFNSFTFGFDFILGKKA